VPAGVFGDWKKGFSRTWCAVDRNSLPPAERLAMERHIQEQKAKAEERREKCRQEAAEKAKKLWSWAKPADPTHPYLQAKKVDPAGLRQHGTTLLVPLTDGLSLVNLQRIFPDGSKRFLSGGRVSGCWSPLDGSDGFLYVCEGWATGATIRAVTGFQVACAMNCGNLQQVARTLRKRNPERHIIIAGDNDRFTEGNPGKASAIEAARAVGGEWKIPDFPEGEKGTDYNDRYLLELEGRL
jgi:putative DNA primase/helicase